MSLLDRLTLALDVLLSLLPVAVAVLIIFGGAALMAAALDRPADRKAPTRKADR